MADADEFVDQADIRVTMIWPKGLKARVRDLTGSRGLTAFVVNAVLERLRDFDSTVIQTERDDARRLTQALVERIQTSGNTALLQSLRLPEWIDGAPTRHVRRPQAPPAATPPAVRASPITHASVSTREPTSQRCPRCGNEMVGSECWTCA